MKGLFLRIFICLFFCSFSLYSYLDKQNQAMELQIRLPKLAKEIEAIRGENGNLRYQIECFENPSHLLDIAMSKEYAHLKFPFAQEVMMVKEGLALNLDPSEEMPQSSKARIPVVVGANP